MSKQDRQGVRTPADLERKYNFGQKFSTSAGDYSYLAEQISRQNQQMAQYMAETNVKISGLEARNEELEEALKLAVEEQSIINEASGEAIVLKDSKAAAFKNLILYGKTIPDSERLINAGTDGSIVVTVEDESQSELQEFSIDTSDGLAGIAVEEGGSYTDGNGQQWVCDEINFALGTLIQRIGRIGSYAGEEIGDIFISSTGELSEGATVIYPLIEAVESKLSSDEIEAFSKLHANNFYTGIQNDAGCWMMVEYIADTKAYIDGKFEGGA